MNSFNCDLDQQMIANKSDGNTWRTHSVTNYEHSFEFLTSLIM